MTALIVFIVVIAANVAYSVCDVFHGQAARQMDDFYRVEYKRVRLAREDEGVVANEWY